MEGRVAILPDEGLPPLPPELRPCPQHIYAGCMATQVMAREMECTPQVMARLEVGRKRLGVSTPPRVQALDRKAVVFASPSLPPPSVCIQPPLADIMRAVKAVQKMWG